jgi:hypothetical protein
VMVRTYPGLAGSPSLDTAACSGWARVSTLFSGNPRPSETLFDILPNQSSYNLRRIEILLGTKPLEHCFLARIYQDRETRRALFELHNRIFLHSHPVSITG